MSLSPVRLQEALTEFERARDELLSVRTEAIAVIERAEKRLGQLNTVLLALGAVIADLEPEAETDTRPPESDQLADEIRQSAAEIESSEPPSMPSCPSVPAGTPVNEAMSALVTPLITDPRAAAEAMDELLRGEPGDDGDWMPHGIERAMAEAPDADTVGDAVLTMAPSMLKASYKPAAQVANETRYPSRNDRTQTRRYRVLEVMTREDRPLRTGEIASLLNDDPAKVSAVMRELLDQKLVEKIAGAYTTSVNAPQLVAAIRDNPVVHAPLDLEPLEEGQDALAVCPHCPGVQRGHAIGWSVAGGRRRLMFQCPKGNTRFFADVPPEPWMKDRTS